MAATTYRFNNGLFSPLAMLRNRLRGRGLWFGLILLAALVAFELFNFSTTEFALVTLFGEHDALGIATWARILAIAFCGIDFAGLSRLFTPETGRKEPKEIWLLTGAWFLGASMNAIMTWWAVGSALSTNPRLGNELLSRADILRYGPLFIALLVWLTRILIIGTFAFAGDHIFTTARRAGRTVEGTARAVGAGGGRPSFPARSEARPIPKPSAQSALPDYGTPSRYSSYASAADDSGSARRYDSQSGFFGRGSGYHNSRPAAHNGVASGFGGERPSPAVADDRSRTFFSERRSSNGGATASGFRGAAPDDSSSRRFFSGSSSNGRNAGGPGGGGSSPAAMTGLFGPDAGESSSASGSNRASSVRSVGSAPSAPSTNELEYVDLD